MRLNDMNYCMGDSLKRKKHQRKVTRAIRTMNKDIEQDKLWKGRFFARTLKTSFRIYPDKSGAVIYVFLQFCDKKTGITRAEWFDEWDIMRWKMFWSMNDFIVNYCDAWRNDNPRYDETDYTKIKFKERKVENV